MRMLTNAIKTLIKKLKEKNIFIGMHKIIYLKFLLRYYVIHILNIFSLLTL